MKIKNAKTIEEYKNIKKEKIQEWIDERFIKGSIEWKYITASTIEIKDKTGDTMQISIDEID